MIDRAEIDRAFQLCLRRDVDSEAAYAYFTGFDSLDSVYAAIFESPEFRGRLAPPPVERAVEPQAVEVRAGAEALVQMLAHVEATWTRLGEEEPHWSVVTDPRFKPGHFAVNAALYQDSGQLDERRFAEAAARAGIDLGGRTTCFELGCGTGRVTEFLARRFPQVVAADISAAHLAVARTSLAAYPNVSLLHLPRLDALSALPPFDALYSRIVLQHNPPPVIAVMLARLLGRLPPGGVAYIQVPVWIPGYRFCAAEYLAGLRTGPMEMHALPQAALLAIVQQAGCRVCDLREDALGPQFGGISNTLLLAKDSVNPG